MIGLPDAEHTLRERLALLLMLVVVSCRPGPTKQADGQPLGFFDVVPESAVASFSGMTPKQFFGEDRLFSLSALTLFQSPNSTAGRLVFRGLSEAAESNDLSSLGVDPNGDFGFALDGALWLERYEELEQRSSVGGLVSIDYGRAKGVVPYLVLPLSSPRSFSRWLMELSTQSKREKLILSERKVRRHKTLFLLGARGGVAVLLAKPFAYVFVLEFLKPERLHERDPIKSIDLFTKGLEEFVERRDQPLRRAPKLKEAIATLSSEGRPLFFLDTERFAKVLPETKPTAAYRVHYKQEMGKSTPDYIEDINDLGFLAERYDAAHRLSEGLSTLAPWLAFVVALDKERSIVTGLAPVTPSLDGEVKALLQTGAAPEYATLLPKETSYLVQLSLAPQGLDPQRGLLRALTEGLLSRGDFLLDDKRLLAGLAQLKSNGADLKKLFVEQATGSIAFAMLGTSTASEGFLKEASTLGGDRNRALSLGDVGALSDAFEIFSLLSAKDLLKTLQQPEALLVVQMKSPEAAEQIILALDATSGKGKATITKQGELRVITREAAFWYVGRAEEFLLIGGDAAKLTQVIERRKAGGGAPMSGPSQGATVSAVLDLDALLLYLAQKEEARGNPEEALYYKGLMGHGAQSFSVWYEGGALRYRAVLP